MALETRKFDIAAYLDSEEAIAEYINQVLADGDAAELGRALGNVARARGMTEVAKEAGVGRQALYGALSEKGNPTYKTLSGVLKVFGLTLQVAPIREPADAA